MSFTSFIIKRLVKNRVEYLGHNDRWDDLYGPWGAKQFESENEAEEYLLNAIAAKHWGGMFAIEKWIISK